ncbi:MAG: LysE family transporter [Spirochaetes bacterium]|nr:LysE family transporter [Spirochaetota bacterium]
MKTLLRGFRFGMLLQLAVGPVCLFVFTMANREGFAAAEFAVLGVALADALYVLAAVAGIAPFLESQRARRLLRNLGAAVVLLFGIGIIVSSLRIRGTAIPFPGIAAEAGGPFLGGFLLTASNPLTIIFWAGVFSSRISAENPGRLGALCFGSGAVLATPLFLSGIAVAGAAATRFLPETITDMVALGAGLVLVLYAVNSWSGGRLWRRVADRRSAPRSDQ